MVISEYIQHGVVSEHMAMQGMVHDRVGRMGLGRYTWMGAPTIYARIIR